jgi:branched-chain amino acid transport system permease protein
MSVTFMVGVITLIAIYATLTLALDLQFSYASLINLGSVAYVAIGAYTYSIVTQAQPGPFDDYKFGLEQPIWVGVLAAALAGLAFGALTGWPSLRLRGEYLALMTFAFAEVLDTFLVNAKSVTNGLVGLPSVLRPFEEMEPDVQTWGFAGLTVALATLTFLLVRRVVTSPYGRVVMAVSDDEQGAAAIGKRVGVTRMQTFLIGAVIMSVAGAFFVMYVSLAVPTIFTPEVTFTVWIALVLGGIRNRWGAVLGATLLIGMQEGLRLLSLPPDQSAFVSSLRLFLTGLLLVVLLRIRPPEHLVRTAARTRRRWRRDPGTTKQPDTEAA